MKCSKVMTVKTTIQPVRGKNNRVMTAMFSPPSSPNERTGPKDGRRDTNCGWNYNMYFSPNLPPSTGSARSVNIDQMEQGYTSIAKSINNLAY